MTEAHWPFATEQISPGIATVLPPGERDATYDRIAGLYDRVVGARLYNRLVWGADPIIYGQAARDALSVANGPAIDVGCGSLVFTAASYADTAMPLVLTDRSLGMLRRAEARLPSGRFLQADAFALPFGDQSFGLVMSWGMLHLFGTASPYLAQLRRLTAPGAHLCLSTLVLADRRVGDGMLRRLHRAGEAAEPETTAAVMARCNALFPDVAATRAGNMLMIVART